MSTSYWLYLHPELQGKKNYWKVGKSLTPYSAVRSRQRFLVDDFYLTAVWFGHPSDVAAMEQIIHSIYRPILGSKLGSSRGELVYYDEEAEGYSLATSIQLAIDLRKASLTRMHTSDPRGYHATCSSQCVFNCVQEKDAHEWSRRLIRSMFNRRVTVKPKTMYEHLFD